MKNKMPLSICQAAVVAAVYVVLTTLNPISWGIVQFRVANIVCILPFLDKKYSPSILLGVAIANAFSPLGFIDVVFGLAAHALCHALFVFGPARNLPLLTKMVSLSTMVALFIGAELTMIYHIPFWAGIVSLFFSTMAVLIFGIIVFVPIKKRGLI